MKLPSSDKGTGLQERDFKNVHPDKRWIHRGKKNIMGAVYLRYCYSWKYSRTGDQWLDMKKKKFMRLNKIYVVLVSLLFVGFFDNEDAFGEPFYSRNLNPFVQVYGLPGIEGGEITSKGRWTGRLQAEMANNYSRSSTATESILLDGETYHLAAVFRYGLSDILELGIDVPYIIHSGGIFDHFIDGWHDFFGLDDGNRHERDRYLLKYSYTSNGVVQHLTEGSSDGIGDVRLSSAYKFYESGDDGAVISCALRSTLKLPTGSAAELHGSKSVDLSLGICGTDTKTFSSAGVFLSGMLGMVHTGSSQVLNSLKKDNVGFASIGAGWRFWRKYELKLQFDAHTPFYESSLNELGVTALQVNFGGSVRLSDSMMFDINMIEDARVGTTPDFVLQIGLKQIF